MTRELTRSACLAIALALSAGAARAQDNQASPHAAGLLAAGFGIARSDVERSAAPPEGGNDYGLFGFGRYLSEQHGRSLAARCTLGVGWENDWVPAGTVALGASYGLLLGSKSQPRHGFHLRAGADVGFDADHRVRSYWIQLPLLELGYGLYTRKVVTELGAVGALEIAGANEFVFDDVHRSRSERRVSAAFGGRSVLLTKDFAFEMRALRVPTRHSGTIDQVEGLACATGGLVACAKLSAIRLATSDARLFGHTALIVIGVGGVGTAHRNLAE